MISLLPTANVPIGSYAMAVRIGDLLYLSGHGAFEDGLPVGLRADRLGPLRDCAVAASDPLGCVRLECAGLAARR